MIQIHTKFWQIFLSKYHAQMCQLTGTTTTSLNALVVKCGWFFAGFFWRGFSLRGNSAAFPGRLNVAAYFTARHFLPFECNYFSPPPSPLPRSGGGEGGEFCKTIKRVVMRDASACRQHRAPIEASFETPLTLKSQSDNVQWGL